MAISFRRLAVLSRPASLHGSFINNGRFIKARPMAAMAVFSTGSGKGPDLLTRAADGRFHIVPCKELISARPSHFLSRAGKAKACQPQWSFYQSRWPFYQGRPASMAVLATMAVLARPRIRPVAAMAVLSTRSGQMAKSLDLASRRSRVSSLSAIFIKGWQSRWPFYQDRPAPMAVLSKPMAVVSSAHARWPSLNGRFINNGRFIKAGPTPDGRFIKANGCFIKAL